MDLHPLTDPCDQMVTVMQALDFVARHPPFDTIYTETGRIVIDGTNKNVYVRIGEILDLSKDEAKRTVFRTMYGGATR